MSDYLWDKRGNDGDVERLENLLSEFRYVPTAAPAIARKAPRWVWRMVPVTSAAMVTLSAIFWSVSFRAPQVALTELIPAAAEVQTTAAVTNPLITTTIPAAAKILPARGTAVQKMRASRKSPRDQFHQSNTAALTKEERDAYEQVLRALYITGTQLRSVNEAVNGVEETRSRSNK